MPRSAHTRRIAPRLIELEPRDVPAGNVTAAIVDTGFFGLELQITGDDLANTVVLTGKGANVIEVRGIGTTVNGGAKAVTFTAVENVRVDTGAGDDTVRGSNLSFRGTDLYEYKRLDILAGDGDDTVQLAGTTADDTSLTIYVGGDDYESLVNGNDRIDISGTTVRGPGFGLSVYADGNYAAENGSDTISVSNTTHTFSGTESQYAISNLQILTGSASARGGSDSLALHHFATDLSAGAVYTYFEIIQGLGDDQVRVSNFDLQSHGRYDSTVAFSVGEWVDYDGDVYGFGGVDTITVSNFDLSATSAEPDYNYAFVNFGAEVTRLSNVVVETDGFAFLGAFTEQADLRNVTVASASNWAEVEVASKGLFDEPTAFESTDFSLTNVHISGGPEYAISASLEVFGGNEPNSVTLVNCSADQLYIDASFWYPDTGDDDEVTVTYSQFGFALITTGVGDDALTLRNNTFGSVSISLGDGDDTASFTNCEGETVYLDTGEGDDAVNMTNCVFVAADLFGGDGTDDLNLTNCEGLFNLDGFEL